MKSVKYVIGAVLLLAGCARYNPPFDHPAVSDAQYQSDVAACRSEAADKMLGASISDRMPAILLGGLGQFATDSDESNPTTTAGIRHNMDLCLERKGYRRL